MRADVQAPGLTAGTNPDCRAGMAVQGWTPKEVPNRGPLISNSDSAVLLEGDLGDSWALHLYKGLRLGLSSANTLLA